MALGGQHLRNTTVLWSSLGMSHLPFHAMTARESLARREDSPSCPEQTRIGEQTTSGFASIQIRQPLGDVKKRYLRGEGR